MHDETETDDATERHLLVGERMALRRWTKELPGEWKPESVRPYETVGYVLEGRAALRVSGSERTLETGDAYHVPRDAPHAYKILETFSAVEATSPPQ